MWADGVYSGLRAEQTKLDALVVIGANERGEKHFLAIEDGVRESTQSWREVLLKLKTRGMNCPRLAIGDRAMGSGRRWRRQKAFDLFIRTYGTPKRHCACTGIARSC